MSDVIFGLAGPPPDPPVIAGKFRPFGAEGFSFKSLLDVVNPLQHLLIVSGAYGFEAVALRSLQSGNSRPPRPL